MKKQLLMAFAILFSMTSIAQTWTKTSTFENPVNAHTLTILANDDVLQVGGDYGFQSYSSDVNVYNVESDTWTALSNYPTNIENHVAFATSETTVLVIAGNVDGAATDAVYEYDVEADTWTAKASLPKALESLSAVKLADGNIFATAGWAAWTPNADTYIYNVSDDSWATVTALPQALVNSAIALLGNGDVVIAGGLNDSFETVASSYTYNVEADAWTQVGDIAYSISGGAMSTSLPEGGAALVGGFDFGTGTFHDKVSVYDAESAVWETLVTIEGGIANGVLVAFENNTLLVAAGNNGAKGEKPAGNPTIAALNGVSNLSSKASLSGAYIVNLDAATITAEDDLPEPRQAPRSTVLSDGRVLITGGAGAVLADDSYNDGVIYEKSMELVVDVTFTIVDEDEMALEAATVIFNELTLTTDINGEAIFSAVSGTTLGYTVLMEAYDTVMVADTDEDAIAVGQVDIAKTVKLTTVIGVKTVTSTLEVNIYPTISNGNITIEAAMGDVLSIKVINQQGQVVETVNNVSGTTQLNLNVNEGIYIVVTENANGAVNTQKLIIQ